MFTGHKQTRQTAGEAIRVGLSQARSAQYVFWCHHPHTISLTPHRMCKHHINRVLIQGAWTMQTHRYSSYEMPHSHSTKYTNTEAGPAYFAPQPAPYTSHPPTNPSGGLSERTADAEQANNITEEEEIQVSNFYCSHVPHVTEWVFDIRNPGAAQP